MGYPVPIDFSAVQIMIVLVIALLVFGPKRLPELGRQIGRGIRDLKSQMNAVTGDLRDAVDRDADEPERTRPGAAPASPPATTPAGDGAAMDDDLLDGVVVSGATGPVAKPPAGS